jgi:hypothetical protein
MVNVPYGTSITGMTASASHTGASISSDPAAPNSYAGLVTYWVTVADNSTQTYTVTVNVASNDAKDITAFYFAIGGKNYGAGTGTEAGSGSISGNNITITVPYGTSVTAMTASVSHTGASISPDPAAATNYSSPVTYTVTAGDSSTQDYTVTVTAAANPAKEITDFYFTINSKKYGAGTGTETGSGSISGNNITITVPYGTSVTVMTPTVIHTGASINPVSGTVWGSSIQKDYTVTAVDNSTRTYSVTVSVAKIASVMGVNGNFASPNGFAQTGGSVNGAAIKAAVTSVTGTDGLGTAIALATADYSVDSIVPAAAGQNTTATLRVPAAKTSTGTDIIKLFTVYIKNDAKKITAFSITSPASAAGTVNEGAKTIAVEAPYGTVKTNMTATLNHTGVSVTSLPSGTPQTGGSATFTGQNFSNARTYRITAEDGTYQDYTVTVTVKPGITIVGANITSPSIPLLTFSASQVTVASGATVTITISGGSATAWHIEISGPQQKSSATASFSAPAVPGFYNINVIATAGGVNYSVSFGLFVQQ